jgi:hypothetical protein
MLALMATLTFSAETRQDSGVATQAYAAPAATNATTASAVETLKRAFMQNLSLSPQRLVARQHRRNIEIVEE